MLIIYSVPPSLYCAKLRILLRNKQLQWEEMPPPGGYGSDEYKRIVPSGNMPAMVDDDLLLGDSEAIAEYLNEKYPEPAMLPTDIGSRAKVRERSRFHDTRLEPEIRALFAHLSPAKRDDVFVATQSEKLNLRLNQLGKLISEPGRIDFDGVSLGDCGLPVSGAWIDALAPALGLQVRWPEAVEQERKRLMQFDAISDELADYLPKLNAYVSQTTAP